LAFKIFQTATATMTRNEKDSFGDRQTASSFPVKIDPDISDKVVYNNQGRIIEGGRTVISPNDNIDPTFGDYTLTFNGREYVVEEIKPVHNIGTNKISHYEVTLK
jgi:hypothetical protein